MRRLRFLIPLLLACAACGNKGFPSPIEGMDAFALTDATLLTQGSCASIQARLTGETGNLTGVALLVEEDACLRCPFSPTLRRDYALDDPAVSLRGDTLAVTRCGLTPPFRLQLLGTSALRNAPVAQSRVLAFDAPTP